LILAPSIALGQTGNSPNAQQTIEAVRNYALNYTQKLPSYTCVLSTHHVTSPANAGNQTPPEMNDSEEELSFTNGKEARTLIRFDGRKIPPGTASPLSEGSQGEFGNILEVIFRPASRTDLRLDRPGKLNGRTVDVLSFHVPQAVGYVLRGSKGFVRVPFEGTVQADAETHAVLRIQMKCTMVPANFEIRNHSLTLEYKSTQVGDREFILPSRFVLQYYDGPDDRVHTNEGRYSGYHQFSADAAVHFDSSERDAKPDIKPNSEPKDK
jgi:hypothetical protein